MLSKQTTLYYVFHVLWIYIAVHSRFIGCPHRQRCHYRIVGCPDASVGIRELREGFPCGLSPVSLAVELWRARSPKASMQWRS